MAKKTTDVICSTAGACLNTYFSRPFRSVVYPASF